jgi:hypothetical protein
MNPPDPILDQLLTAVRATKRRRQWRRGVMATASVVAAAIFLMPRHHDPAAPLAASPPPVQEAAAAVETTTLAVMVWQDGMPVLEELAASELEDIQLEFGLQPVTTYPGPLLKELQN